MYNPQDIIKRCSEKLNLKRVVYNDKKIPTSIDNVVIFPFFGDMRSSFVLSSILLRRIKEELKGSKYLILLSWPGHQGLYPYVDEYWTIEDEGVLDKLRFEINGFQNFSSYYTLLSRSLNEYFFEIFTCKDLLPYYDNGLTKEFFERFKHIKVSLPAINSGAFLGIDFARHIASKDLKFFMYPSKYIYTWKMGKVEKLSTSKDFWIAFVGKMIYDGFYPVIYRDIFCHDLSTELSEDCLHIWENDISKVLTAMRTVGFVIDFFSGISRLAICARTPFLCFDERNRYNNTKEYEIDDICGKDLFKDYIFSFATIINSESKDNWRVNILDPVTSKLNKLFPLINRDSYPSATESNKIVPYENVRKNKVKKFGSRFIKINREEI